MRLHTTGCALRIYCSSHTHLHTLVRYYYPVPVCHFAFWLPSRGYAYWFAFSSLVLQFSAPVTLPLPRWLDYNTVTLLQLRSRLLPLRFRLPAVAVLQVTRSVYVRDFTFTVHRYTRTHTRSRSARLRFARVCRSLRLLHTIFAHTHRSRFHALRVLYIRLGYCTRRLGSATRLLLYTGSLPFCYGLPFGLVHTHTRCTVHIPFTTVGLVVVTTRLYVYAPLPLRLHLHTRITQFVTVAVPAVGCCSCSTLTVAFTRLDYRLRTRSYPALPYDVVPHLPVTYTVTQFPRSRWLPLPVPVLHAHVYLYVLLPVIYRGFCLYAFCLAGCRAVLPAVHLCRLPVTVVPVPHFTPAGSRCGYTWLPVAVYRTLHYRVHGLLPRLFTGFWLPHVLPACRLPLRAAPLVAVTVTGYHVLRWLFVPRAF